MDAPCINLSFVLESGLDKACPHFFEDFGNYTETGGWPLCCSEDQISKQNIIQMTLVKRHITPFGGL